MTERQYLLNVWRLGITIRQRNVYDPQRGALVLRVYEVPEEVSK
jgi:hypothetical protein